MPGNATIFSKKFHFSCLHVFVDFKVQQEILRLEQLLNEDEGYAGSQEKRNTSVSLEECQEGNILDSYFNEAPNLNDCSFDILCAQASAYPEVNAHLPFEDL